MYPNFLNNLSLNRFMTNYHKLSSATSLAIQAARRLQQYKKLTKMQIQKMLFPLP